MDRNTKLEIGDDVWWVERDTVITAKVTSLGGYEPRIIGVKTWSGCNTVMDKEYLYKGKTQRGIL